MICEAYAGNVLCHTPEGKRVTLVDPGYLDPSDLDVEIALRQEGWTNCHDILGNQELPIRKHGISPNTTMGTL